MRHRNLLLPVLTTAFIATYFLWLTRDALHSYFSPDACMTMYWSWANSAGVLLKANLFFFREQPFFRPMTTPWYRVMFDLAGFNPLPFHIASLMILSANIWFTYCVSRRLTGSRETGALAALLVSYHGRLMPLYFDTGHSYDVTCYFFYFSTFLFYLRVRSRQRPLRWQELVVLSAPYTCAFNCKELAVTLPVMLTVYEWLYHRPSIGSLRDFRRWLISDGRAVPLTGVLTLVYHRPVSKRASCGLRLYTGFHVGPLHDHEPQFCLGGRKCGTSPSRPKNIDRSSSNSISSSRSCGRIRGCCFSTIH